MADATPTMFYDIAVSKDDKGYWQWDSFVAGAPAEAGTMAPAGPSKAVVAPKSNYETPEERAKRQVYIVKQSSISNAIAFLTHNNAKSTFSGDQVLEVAQKFTDFVFAENKQAGTAELFDLPNDIEVE